MDTVQDSDYHILLLLFGDTANRPRIDDKRYEQAAFYHQNRSSSK